MPCFNSKLTEEKQFLINIFIIDTRKSFSDGVEVEFEKQKRYTALVDTGASGTCIVEEVAKELELIPTCKKSVQTAGNPVDCNEYDVRIAIPVTEITSYQQIIEKDKPKFIPKGGVTHIKAWQCQATGLPTQQEQRGYDCLLGMDVLRTCSFQYTGGILTICF